MRKIHLLLLLAGFLLPTRELRSESAVPAELGPEFYLKWEKQFGKKIPESGTLGGLTCESAPPPKCNRCLGKINDVEVKLLPLKWSLEADCTAERVEFVPAPKTPAIIARATPRGVWGETEEGECYSLEAQSWVLPGGTVLVAGAEFWNQSELMIFMSKKYVDNVDARKALWARLRGGVEIEQNAWKTLEAKLQEAISASKVGLPVNKPQPDLEFWKKWTSVAKAETNPSMRACLYLWLDERAPVEIPYGQEKEYASLGLISRREFKDIVYSHSLLDLALASSGTTCAGFAALKLGWKTFWSFDTITSELAKVEADPKMPTEAKELARYYSFIGSVVKKGIKDSELLSAADQLAKNSTLFGTWAKDARALLKMGDRPVMRKENVYCD